MTSALSDNPAILAWMPHLMPAAWAYVEARQKAGEFISDPDLLARHWAQAEASKKVMRGEPLPNGVADSFALPLATVRANRERCGIERRAAA